MPNDDPADWTLWQHHGIRLRALLRAETFPGLCLVTGPAGSGKTQIARRIARFLNCRAPKSLAIPRRQNALDDLPLPAPCEICTHCRQAQNGQLLAITEIALEEGSWLKIEQFRAMKENSGFKVAPDERRVILIHQAQKMTVQAANSLLKIFEEVPPRWHFLMTVPHPSLLLPTLVSRAQILRLTPLSDQELQSALASFIATLPGSVLPSLPDADEIRTLHGSWERARNLIEPQASRQILRSFFAQPHAQLAATLEWALSAEEPLAELLDQLEMQIWQMVTFPNAQSGELQFAFNQLARVAETRRVLHTPLNKKLLVACLLDPWVLRQVA